MFTEIQDKLAFIFGEASPVFRLLCIFFSYSVYYFLSHSIHWLFLILLEAAVFPSAEVGNESAAVSDSI